MLPRKHRNRMGTGRPRRERLQSVRAVKAALAAHDRIQEVSDGIRTRYGLAPVPENVTVTSWRAQVAEG